MATAPATTEVYDVANDTAGNSFLVGSFAGTVQIGTVVLSSSGNTDFDGFVVKLAPTGAVVWAKRHGGPGSQSTSTVSVDPAGNVLVGGATCGSVDFGGGVAASSTCTGTAPTDGFIAKLSSTNGAASWALGVAEYLSREVVADANGVYVLSADRPFPLSDPWPMRLRKYSASGALLWTYQPNGLVNVEDVELTSSGQVWLAGYLDGNTIQFATGSKTSTDSATFLARLDADGNESFVEVFGDGANWPTDIVRDESGGVYITGGYVSATNLGGVVLPAFGGTDAFIAHLGASAQHLWSRGYGSGANEAGGGVARLSDGSVVWVGASEGTLDFGVGSHVPVGGSDVFVVRLSPTGDTIWSRYLGGAGDDRLTAVAVAPGDDFVAVGTTDGQINLGGGLLFPSDGVEGMAVRLGP
ncbi:MAG: hypothetical protein KC731_38620 [Myxococcales bacterium]|nr:hypothetical protein [Myxococcales bacterium]